jgi:hypothetical protein
MIRASSRSSRRVRTTGRLWFAMELMEGETSSKRLTGPRRLRRGGCRRASAIESPGRSTPRLRQKIAPPRREAGQHLSPARRLGEACGLRPRRSAELARTKLTDLKPSPARPEYALAGAGRRTGRPTTGATSIRWLRLYEMVTEAPPFAGDSRMATLSSTPRNLRRRRAPQSRRLRGVRSRGPRCWRRIRTTASRAMRTSSTRCCRRRSRCSRRRGRRRRSSRAAARLDLARSPRRPA